MRTYICFIILFVTQVAFGQTDYLTMGTDSIELTREYYQDGQTPFEIRWVKKIDTTILHPHFAPTFTFDPSNILVIATSEPYTKTDSIATNKFFGETTKEDVGRQLGFSRITDWKKNLVDCDLTFFTVGDTMIMHSYSHESNNFTEFLNSIEISDYLILKTIIHPDDPLKDERVELEGICWKLKN